MIHPPDWYARNGIRLFMGQEVVAIDRGNRRVTAGEGATAEYDRLLLATGSHPIVLPLPGADLKGVVTFRDLKDVERMLKSARMKKNGPL